jgi:pyruvate/2-oxoglutarate dehydrogenase complex dihydrolipoamide dehydrogenase (E3) component
VTLRLNTFLDETEVAAHPADTVILATGSLPDPDARQRWMPDAASLPGLENGHVWSPEEVIRREARLGDTVIVYDEGGNWRGGGTAWWLAEQGKSVILVTPDPMVGRELTRTAADGALRRALAAKGAQMLTEHCIARWHGNGASLRNMLTGQDIQVPASALVMATTNIAFDPFPEKFEGKALHRIGDCAAPRLAAYAFHEGRKLALSL